MPRSAPMRFTCSCGTTFDAEIYQVVNITLEPSLLYRLLSGNLNVATCPNCGRQSDSGQSYLYHDMARSLFAYVHPDPDLPEEDRNALLEHLRRVYSRAVEESERVTRQSAPAEQPRPSVHRSKPYDDLRATIEPDAPPMQVIFGTDRLIALVDSLLEPEEKLARVALSSKSNDKAAQDRLVRVARQMAEQMHCETSVDDEPDAFTVWIYGSRARVSQIAQALNAPA